MAIWVDWYLSRYLIYVFVILSTHLFFVIIYHLHHQVQVLEDFFSIMNDVHSCLQLDDNIYYS